MFVYARVIEKYLKEENMTNHIEIKISGAGNLDMHLVGKSVMQARTVIQDNKFLFIIFCASKLVGVNSLTEFRSAAKEVIGKIIGDFECGDFPPQMKNERFFMIARAKRFMTPLKSQDMKTVDEQGYPIVGPFCHKFQSEQNSFKYVRNLTMKRTVDVRLDALPQGLFQIPPKCLEEEEPYIATMNAFLPTFLKRNPAVCIAEALGLYVELICTFANHMCDTTQTRNGDEHIMDLHVRSQLFHDVLAQTRASEEICLSLDGFSTFVLKQNFALMGVFNTFLAITNDEQSPDSYNQGLGLSNFPIVLGRFLSPTTISWNSVRRTSHLWTTNIRLPQKTNGAPTPAAQSPTTQTTSSINPDEM